MMWHWPEEWTPEVRNAADALYRCIFPRSGARITAIERLVAAMMVPRKEPLDIESVAKGTLDSSVGAPQEKAE
jgi:hypothetical protein